MTKASSSVGLLLATAPGYGVSNNTLQKETKSFVFSPASKVNFFLIIAKVLFSRYVLVQSTLCTALTGNPCARERNKKQEGETQILDTEKVSQKDETIQ